MQRTVYHDLIGRLTQTKHLGVKADIDIKGILTGFEENGVAIGAEFIPGLPSIYEIKIALDCRHGH